jgi:hypothetical protein
MESANSTMALKQLTRLLFSIQKQLLPALEEAMGPLNMQEQRFVKVLELLKLHKHVDRLGWKGNGRPPNSHLFMARAFVAKATWNMPTTNDLIRQLEGNTNLRRLCGWEDGPSSVPDKSVFSRAFAAFAHIELGQRVHEALISEQLGKEVIEHAATDGTAIEARERVKPPAQPAAAQAERPKRKRGRPHKGEVVPPPEPTRLQRHLERLLEDNLNDMPPVRCDWGCKTNSQGHTDYWRGYKLHIITGDGDIPLSAYLSSASMHDSQAAIILEQSAAARTKALLYQLKDSAYDAAAIREHSEKIGSIPIIEKRGYRSAEAVPMEPDRARRYKARSSAERVNSDLKDNHGGRTVRVRSAAKVGLHLMFGLLVMSAEALLRLAQ